MSEFRLLHAPVPADLVEALYAKAEAEGKTLAEATAEAVAAYVQDQSGKPANPPRRKPRGRTA